MMTVNGLGELIGIKSVSVRQHNIDMYHKYKVEYDTFRNEIGRKNNLYLYPLGSKDNKARREYIDALSDFVELFNDRITDEEMMTECESIMKTLLKKYGIPHEYEF